METEAEKIIADQVKKLPKEVRDALASDELHKKIVAIGEKHHLHIDQIGLLEDEVTLVMMGMADPGELADTMATQMSLSKPDAEAIASDVSQDIFLPIRDAMKKFTGDQTPSVVMPSAANTAPKPAPIPTPVVPPQKPVTPPPAPAAKPPEMHAELMLREATVSMPPKIVTPAPVASAPAPTPAPVAPKVEAPPSTSSGQAKPAPYKADPYREPPE